MTDNVKLFGVTMDSMVTSTSMYNQFAEKASNRIRAFSRIASNLEYEKNVML